jgi:Circadian oscillating protein COP23
MKKPLKIFTVGIVSTIVAASSALAQVGPPTPQTSVPAGGTQTRFRCDYLNTQYTVAYYPADRPGQSYPWAIPGNMGGGWNASKRCAEISRRLEEYRKDGLKELRTEVKNQYDTVCVTTEKNSSCRIVFTVPLGKDAITTRDSVFRNLTMADSGQQTQGVNTFTAGGGGNINFGNILGSIGIPGLPGGGGSNNPAPVTKKHSDGIDLRPFLSTADGGTAANLAPIPKKTTPVKTNKTKQNGLNLDRFRQ